MYGKRGFGFPIPHQVDNLSRLSFINLLRWVTGYAKKKYKTIKLSRVSGESMVSFIKTLSTGASRIPEITNGIVRLFVRELSR